MPALTAEEGMGMKLLVLFFTRLSALLAKWAIIGVLWFGSVFLVTSSALLMDQFSDWARIIGSYTTPYANQKATIAKQKRMVKAHSAKVKKIGGKMVARNAADATISTIPVIGGVATVSFAVLDVYQVCELITETKRFELRMGTATADDYSRLDDACVSTTASVEAAGKKAKEAMDVVKATTAAMPDWVADQLCDITDNCAGA